MQHSIIAFYFGHSIENRSKVKPRSNLSCLTNQQKETANKPIRFREKKTHDNSQAQETCVACRVVIIILRFLESYWLKTHNLCSDWLRHTRQLNLVNFW